jgi:ribosomal protein L24E
MGEEMIAAARSPVPDRASAWSAEETAYRQRDGSTLWQVEAKCDEHWILVWGRSRNQAWTAASRMASRIQREP